METPVPPGQRFAYWLAKAAVKARQQAGVDIGHVLVHDPGISPEQLKRFEKGAKNWPREPEQLMNAYAKASGLQDQRDIYRQALDLWYEHGEAPALDATDGQEPQWRIEPPSAPQARPAPSRKPTAKPKRQASS